MSGSDRDIFPSSSTSSRRRSDEPGEDDRMLFEAVMAAIEVTEEEHEAVAVAVHVFRDPDVDARARTPWSKAR